MTKFCIYAAFISALALSSCHNVSVPGISPNEDKGVKEIYAFYGGLLKYSIKNTASTNDGVKKYFELEISQSKAVSDFKQHPDMPGSNLAYMFYHNLKQEKNKYDEIHTSINIDDQKYAYSFKKEELAIVEKKMKLVEELVELLKNRNYEGLKPKLNPDTTIIKIDTAMYFKELAQYDEQFGKIKEFQPVGFAFVNPKPDSDIRLLHISGVLVRDKQNSEFSVDMDPTLNKDEFMLLRYNL